MSTKKEREIENIIHGYCPHWAKWALMIEKKQANQPVYLYVKEAAVEELKKAVAAILKITKPRRIRRQA